MNEDSTRSSQSQGIQVVVFQPGPVGEDRSNAFMLPLLAWESRIPKTCFKTLNDDALLRIFGFCRPGGWNQPVEVDASAILDRQAPESVSRVCRSWRDLVLSVPRLWATIKLRSVNPSNVSLNAMARYTRHCLDRSKGSLLECFIVLEGTFDVLRARRIGMMLTEHQRRWERIYIKIRPSPPSQTDGGEPHLNDLGVGTRVPPIELNAEK